VFRRWLRLLRDGPGLLGATSLADLVQAVESCDCGGLYRRDTKVSTSKSNEVAQDNAYLDPLAPKIGKINPSRMP
jgi:hypothetical protein